jgi:hypothetical protein
MRPDLWVVTNVNLIGVGTTSPWLLPRLLLSGLHDHLNPTLRYLLNRVIVVAVRSNVQNWRAFLDALLEQLNNLLIQRVAMPCAIVVKKAYLVLAVWQSLNLV